MKVVHITTGYNHGGAAIACKRLVEAQRDIGIEASVITQEAGDFPDYVYSTTRSKIKKRLNFMRHAWEKFIFLFYEKSGKYRFQFSLANTGESIQNLQVINEADIIHFHWFNAGFISIEGFKKSLDLKKPIVWTLHDMWAFTGGCHYAGQCVNYIHQCGNCNYLKLNSNKDLSYRIWGEKNTVYSAGNLNVVTPSNWLASCTKQSGLLKNVPVNVIPNALNNIPIVQTRNEIREELHLPKDKKLILFGAFNLNHTRKGANFLMEALTKIEKIDDYELMVFGKKNELLSDLVINKHFLGYSSNETFIRKIYKAADVFVNPSIEDNLPNTVLESLSVGTPVVAFNMGGMPDMIDHKKNGYLAHYKDACDLAIGIEWCLQNENNSSLSANALLKIENVFSPNKVAEQFDHFYQSILNADEAKN